MLKDSPCFAGVSCANVLVAKTIDNPANKNLILFINCNFSNF